MATLAGRIALVTGASRGIGRAAALALAAAGAHVMAVARTVGGLEELDDEIKKAGGSATLVPLDLRDFAGIDRMGQAIFQRWGKLDILVANAGILGPVTPLGHIAVQQWAELLDINLTANWRLLRALDLLLRQSDAGRAIFVSSGAAISPRPFLGGYAVTKAALEMLAKTYAEECEGSHLRVSIVNPGPMRTRMRKNLMPGEDPSTLPEPAALAPLLLALASPAWSAQGERIDFEAWAKSRA